MSSPFRRLTVRRLFAAAMGLPRRLVTFRRERRILRWDVKVLGYHLARQMALALPPVAPGATPKRVGLTSKGCVQADIESEWLAYWAHRLRATPIYHRKLWEFCFILQALFDAGALAPGAQAIGFGCGEEPLPSLFAQMGISVVATDAPPEIIKGSGWDDTGQYARSLDALYKPELCERPAFDRIVSLRYADMNRIPVDLAGQFDFAWSACALEHLGTIDKGLDFIEESLKCLRPGGIAVHTTEWNFAADDATIDKGPTVLFQRKHFEAVAARLSAKGFTVEPLDFDLGSGPLDQFVDIPPYAWDRANRPSDLMRDDQAHLRLAVGGFAVTSFGIIVKRPEAAA